MHSTSETKSSAAERGRGNTHAFRQALANVLQSKEASFFLCAANAALSQIILHTIHRQAAAAARQAARAALADAGLSCTVNVVAHDKAVLDRPRSLEQLLAAFPHDIIIHDPTAVFGRARALVTAVKQTRADFGSAIRGIYLHPAARLLYVVAADEDLATRLTNSLEQAIETSAAALGSIQLNRPPIRVRVVRDLPKLELVAIDRQSAQPVSGAPARRWMAALAAAIGLAAAPAAAMAHQADVKFQTASAALPGLSVFSDGGGVSAFTSRGLNYYFGLTVQLSRYQQMAQVQMPEVNVFGLQVRPRTGVPGADPDQGGSVGS